MISASALIRTHICPHYWHLQCFGDSSKTVKPDAGALLRIEAGLKHEQEIIATLDAVQPKYNKERPWEGVEPTLYVMREGVPLIYHGVLKNDRMFGVPDLLERTDIKSSFGTYSYRPIDIKSHSKVTKRDKFQLAAYALILHQAQGLIPTEGAIFLKNGSRQNVPINTELADIKNAMRVALSVEAKSLSTLPLRCSECEYCQWNEYCDFERLDSRLVTLLAGTDINLVRKLIDAGITTYDTLASQVPSQIAKQFKLSLDKAVSLSQYARAWTNGVPVVVKKIKLPPEKKTVIHYDIETYGDTLYMHGLLIVDGGKTFVQQFVAKSVNEEEKTLSEFLSFAGRFEGAVIYTWTTYENKWMEAMAERYPKKRKMIQKLLGQFEDLKEIVKETVALPVASFSIKKVAPVFGFKWRAEDAGGSASEAWYDQWLKSGDQQIFQKLLHYNEDDIKAMDVVFRELKKLLKLKPAHHFRSRR